MPGEFNVRGFYLEGWSAASACACTEITEDDGDRSWSVFLQCAECGELEAIYLTREYLSRVMVTRRRRGVAPRRRNPYSLETTHGQLAPKTAGAAPGARSRIPATARRTASTPRYRVPLREKAGNNRQTPV